MGNDRFSTPGDYTCETKCFTRKNARGNKGMVMFAPGERLTGVVALPCPKCGGKGEDCEKCRGTGREWPPHHFVEDGAIPAPAPVVEPEDEDEGPTDEEKIDELRQKFEEKGFAYDGRWGVERLEKELALKSRAGRPGVI